MPLSDFYAALRWWLVLLVLGLAVWPLAFTLFGRLSDRGYAFTKMLGLLLVGYLAWILGSLGFLGNNLGGILVALAAVAGLSYWLYWRLERPSLTAPENGDGRTLTNWLRQNWVQVLLTELVFAVMFAVWVWARAQNPAISATEKPMEFAFLNAVGRSDTFPPLDPWLSGYAISYYYFGYIMSSLLAQLAQVSEPIAFNLSVAWLFAGAATGAFGLVYNLLAAEGAGHSARVLGLIAALALPLAGNLTIGLEIAHANEVGNPAFWQWLDVRELNAPPEGASPARFETSNWWWWRSSRPLREYHLSGRPEDGLEPIAEFPAFSFVLGDLHPHVLALPFAFLSLALALLWWLPRRKEPDPDDLGQSADDGWLASLQSLVHEIGVPLWLFSALVMGGLAFLNTWDVLVHLLVILGAFLLAKWRDEGWHARLLSQTVLVGLLLLIPAILLYLPFFLGFRSQAGAPYLLPMLMRPTRLSQFLIIFGMPLWAITIFLLALAARQKFRYWQSGLITAVSLLLGLLIFALLFASVVAISPEGASRVGGLAGELGIPLPPHPEHNLAIGWGLSAVFALLPAYLGARIAVPALTLLLLTIIGLVVMIWRDLLGREPGPGSAGNTTALPFALLLIGIGALLTLGPEFVFLRDNFGARLNTIFKFYYQAWVLFGVAALYAIGYLWLAWQGRARVVPLVATVGYALALMVALLFPLYATNSRAMEYRGPATAENRLPPTLNGLAQTERFNADEYAALLWLREQVSGTPVILEAVGGQYSGFGRVSAATGLPTVLGWAGHQYQWRGETPEPGERDPAVREVYSQPDLTAVAPILDRYNVQYIYVGGLERDTYGLAGLDKFAEQLDLAYSNGSVAIYRWQPQ